MSLIRASRCCPLSRMSWMYSAYFGLPSEPNICDSIISAKPMITFSGERSSWLILARNCDLARLAGPPPPACLPQSLLVQLQRSDVRPNADQAAFSGGTVTDADPAAGGKLALLV